MRSSTNSEDLPGFAGAGLYTTVPNVRSEAEVLEAVKTVWASIWSDRAYEARERAGIDHATALPAVLIQEGVEADSAGVMVTADPTDPSDEDAVLLAAKRGLGFRVVEGHEPPEHVLYRPRGDSIATLNRSGDGLMLAFAEASGAGRAVHRGALRRRAPGYRVAHCGGAGADRAVPALPHPGPGALPGPMI